jgi:outer membrane immunogenic protein
LKPSVDRHLPRAFAENGLILAMRGIGAVTIILAVAAAFPAFAADLPVHAPPAAPFAFSWTGCHVGGHLGGAVSEDKDSFIFGGSRSFSSTNFVGGGQIGCDYQFAPGWVAGAEGGVAWTGLRNTHPASVTSLITGITVPSQFTFSNDFLASATARLGRSFADRWLVFVRGGAAWTREKVDDAFTLPASGIAVDPGVTMTRSGWTAGVGVEWAFAPRWSATLEYNYYDFGSRDTTLTNSTNNTYVILGSLKDTIHTVTVGVNYQFDSPAVAAKSPVGTYTKAPAMVADVYNWTGFYVGGDIGEAWAADSGTSDFFDPTFPKYFTVAMRQGAPATNPQTSSLRSSTAIGGVHAGFNWQLSHWVIGAEGDYQWTTAENRFCRQTSVFGAPCADNGLGFLTLGERADWIATVRARLGYTWDRFMVYGTGGAAWSNIETSINANCLVGGCGNSILQLYTTQNFSNAKAGWVAGAGIEAMLSRNWIARAEYLHTEFGDTTNALNLVARSLQGVTFPTQTASWSRSLTYDTVRVGVSYKFWGPVIAASPG